MDSLAFGCKFLYRRLSETPGKKSNIKSINDCTLDEIDNEIMLKELDLT